MHIAGRLLPLVEKLLIALGIASFFIFLSIFPRVGYFGNAYVGRGDVRVYGIYAVANYTYSITYNPMIFPFTWLSGNGIDSGRSTVTILPEGNMLVQIWWPSYQEMSEAALTHTAFLEIQPNFLTLFAIFLVIELVRMRFLYVWFVSGIIGFVSGGLIGTIVSLSIGTFIVVFLMIKSDKGSIVKKSE